MIWTMLFLLAQIGFGLLYGNLVEWVAHKYFLHKLGRKKSSWFSFHWVDHHRKSRLNKFYDDDYEKSVWHWNARGKEALALGILCLGHLWVAFLAPVVFFALVYCTINYYFTHKWAHENPEWCKKHLRWHWEHHMGKNQEANFCITQPWFDYILGTRIHYREEKLPSGKAKIVEIKVPHPLRQAA